MTSPRKKHYEQVDPLNGHRFAVSWIESDETSKRAAKSPWLATDPWLAHGIHGYSREWFSTGQIARSSCFRHGTLCGITSWWDAGGLLKAFSVAWRGIEHIRSFNWRTQCYSSMITIDDGVWGILRVWDEGGDLLAKSFQVRNASVSEKRFHSQFAAAEIRANHRDAISESIHPRYNIFNLEQWMTLDTITKLLIHAKEARAWLSATNDRGIGEGRTKADSAGVIEHVYSLGASNVWVADIKDEGDGNESSSVLLIGLPEDLEARKAILAWHNEIAEGSGFDTEQDVGQAMLLTMMD